MVRKIMLKNHVNLLSSLTLARYYKNYDAYRYVYSLGSDSGLNDTSKYLPLQHNTT